MVKSTIVSAVFLMAHIQSAQLCSPYICFTWKVSNHNLTLICKVSDLHLRVAISDPLGQTQAECIPPFPAVHCQQYNRNGLITQNPRTNETLYIVTGSIDYHYNGIWTCRHGSNFNTARVEVTILRQGTMAQNTTRPTEPFSPVYTDTAKLQCAKNVLVFSMAGFILFTVLSSVVISCYSKSMIYIKEISGELCLSKNSTQATLKRRTGFAVLTMSFFSFSFMIGYFDDGSCQYIIWILTAFGGIIGIIGSCMCLIVHEHVDENGVNNDSTMYALRSGQGEEDSRV